MANREALRELQTRLASRLQAARTEGTSVSSWLAVESAGSFYLLPLGQSGEIFPWVSVQAVPYTQSWFLGVANLRGGLVGVVDLAGLLGSNTVRTEQALSEANLLAFNAALDVNAALLVDRLAGLRGTDAFVERDQRAVYRGQLRGQRFRRVPGHGVGRGEVEMLPELFDDVIEQRLAHPDLRPRLSHRSFPECAE